MSSPAASPDPSDAALGLPAGAVRNGGTPVWTEADLPAKVTQQHSLRAGKWGVLRVLEGSVQFVDLRGGTSPWLQAPDSILIEPEAPHRLNVEDATFRVQIEFYRIPDSEVVRGEPS